MQFGENRLATSGANSGQRARSILWTEALDKLTLNKTFYLISTSFAQPLIDDLFFYFFSTILKDTVPIDGIISVKNAQAWVSMDFS